jgi:hypothetical protein
MPKVVHGSIRARVKVHVGVVPMRHYLFVRKVCRTGVRSVPRVGAVGVHQALTDVTRVMSCETYSCVKFAVREERCDGVMRHRGGFHGWRYDAVVPACVLYREYAL